MVHRCSPWRFSPRADSRGLAARVLEGLQQEGEHGREDRQQQQQEV
jgi:hypothetical protein